MPAANLYAKDCISLAPSPSWLLGQFRHSSSDQELQLHLHFFCCLLYWRFTVHLSKFRLEMLPFL